MVSAATMTVALGAAGQSAVAEPVNRATTIAPEADVSHHGHVSLSGDRLGIWLRSTNRGRRAWPTRPYGCASRRRWPRAGAAGRLHPGAERAVLCETGALGVDGEIRRTELALRIKGRPAEVVVRVDTVWNGGASDRNQENNTHQVRATATGDAYVF
ncbi:hypothetical protein NKH18_22545 [Streptomyces sp. M10(2022)]